MRQPMLDLRLFGNRLFRVTNLVSLFSSAGFLGVLFIGPLFGRKPPHANTGDEQGDRQDADFFHFRHDTILMYIRLLIANTHFVYD